MNATVAHDTRAVRSLPRRTRCSSSIRASACKSRTGPRGGYLGLSEAAWRKIGRLKLLTRKTSSGEAAREKARIQRWNGEYLWFDPHLYPLRDWIADKSRANRPLVDERARPCVRTVRRRGPAPHAGIDAGFLLGATAEHGSVAHKMMIRLDQPRRAATL